MTLRILLLLLAGVCTAFADRPLEDAARTVVQKLPAGGIVTAERIDGKDRFAVAGKPEPAGIAPEKRVFEIGSITKVFTGLLLADAVGSGKVRLDSTLGELLGEDQKFADPKVAKITLLQLSTHTSGLPRLPSNLGPNPDGAADPYARYDRKLMRGFLAGAKLQAEPPLPAAYSNFGVGLLGELLAEAHGVSWDALVKEKITGPLGMKDTAMLPGADQLARLAPPYAGGKPGHSWTFQAMAGAGALRSTAADLLIFGQALLEPGKTPLAAPIKRMLEARSPYGGMGSEIGLGIIIGKIDGQREYNHSGGTGGYRSLLQVIPERKLVRVVLINNSDMAAEAVVAATRDDKPSTAPEQKLTEAELKAYTGEFELAPGQVITTTVKAGNLFAQLTGQPAFPVFQTKPGYFEYDVVEAALEFTRDKNETVTGLLLHQNGRHPAKKR